MKPITAPGSPLQLQNTTGSAAATYQPNVGRSCQATAMTRLNVVDQLQSLPLLQQDCRNERHRCSRK